jgi:hypothetical protein
MEGKHFRGLEIEYKTLKNKIQYKNRVTARAISQAVSRWLPTAAARIQNRI